MAFLGASAMMLFSGDFWRYAALPMGVFLLFSLGLRLLAERTSRPFLRRWFPLLYPLAALVTVIPGVMAVQFGPLLAGGGGGAYGLLGLVLNLLAYFYLNLAIGLAWLAADRIGKRPG